MRAMLKSISRYEKILLILLLLSLAIFIARALSPTPASIDLTSITPISLADHQRLLILAPHCDDETLGSAGLIQAALRAGLQVRVVIATNGDGYLFAIMQDFHKIYPRPADFIRLGKLRQQESLAALYLLGVKPGNVIFLSYPDRGTPALWNDHWASDAPYRSPFSEDSKSPYPLTYDPHSVYAGQDYLADLSSILADYRPDLIVFPHPQDVHPDHWGLNVFTRLAVTMAKHVDPAYTPTEFTYLVHRPDFPEVKGLEPLEPLVPPPALYRTSQNWYRLDLTSSDESRKDQALQQYRSQLPLLRGLMESFIRINELFAPVQDAVLPELGRGDAQDPSTWTDSSGRSIPMIQTDPVADFITRDAIPAGDLVGFYAARDAQDNLLICSQTRENAIAGLTYSIRLKALSGEAITAFHAETRQTTKPAGQVARRNGLFICASFPLTDLGDPWAVFVGVNSAGGCRVMDETAWQMIYIKKP